MAVNVLAVLGGGGRAGVTRLLADDRVRLVDSPRHADVLVVVGAVPAALGPALRGVHDQLAAPRAVVWWTRTPEALPGIDHAEPVTAADPVPALAAAADGSTQPLLQADEPPAEWRGVGPYGTGGKGMMGGSPYGRPMTMTDDDLRDGLALDALQMRVGPLFPHLPTGLTLDVTLQGDVVVEVEVGDSPFATDPATWRGAPPPDHAGPDRQVVVGAHDGAVGVADVEVARARHQLGVVAGTLRLAGLDALARRTARLAVTAAPGDGPAVRRLAGWLRRSGAVRWLLAGVGHVGPHTAGGGPVARAAGAAVDARTTAPAYADLGFSVVTHRRGDALARLRQRLAEAAQALDIAAAARQRRTRADGLEGPLGPVRAHPAPPTRLLDDLPELLRGMEWGDVVTTVDSLDLDPTAFAGTHRRAAA